MNSSTSVGGTGGGNVVRSGIISQLQALEQIALSMQPALQTEMSQADVRNLCSRMSSIQGQTKQSQALLKRWHH